MNSGRILIVEDEGLVATDLESCLVRLGYSVTGIADNAADALRAAAADPPDLALMDINILGPTDGVELAAELRRRFRVPVIFLTSYADRKTVERAGTAEPFGYLVKPFEEAGLSATITTAFHRHRAEQRLGQMERWLATTLRSIGDAVIATDLEGRITFINPVAEKLTGWALHDALGCSFSTVFRSFTGGDQEMLWDHAQRVIRLNSDANLALDVSLVAKDDTEIPVSTTVAPIRDDAGNISGTIVVFRDITERRRFEMERQRMEEKLRETQKLESLRLMAAGVAHDFNNLLTAVIGYAELVDQTLPPDAGQRNCLSQIIAASQRGAKLCKHMLAYTGRDMRTAQWSDVSRIVSEMSDQIRVSISKDADLRLHLPSDLPPVLCDPGQLQQVILHLVLNASEALEGQPGRIQLGAGTMHVSKQLIAIADVAAADCTEGEHVYFDVSDTGCGMSGETMGRIFDPFFSTKFLGRGLGLAAVSGIIRSHRGALLVNSELQQGTHFRVLLPIGDPRQAVLTAASKAA